jgi:hypothetical protein
MKYTWKYSNSADIHILYLKRECDDWLLGAIHLHEHIVANKVFIEFYCLHEFENLYKTKYGGESLFTYEGSLEECKLMIQEFVRKTEILLPFI